MQFQKFNPKS